MRMLRTVHQNDEAIQQSDQSSQVGSEFELGSFGP